MNIIITSQRGREILAVVRELNPINADVSTGYADKQSNTRS